MDTDRLAQLFVELADTMVDEFDVLDLFHNLVSGCAELLDARLVGLALAGDVHGLQPVASSDHAGPSLRLLEISSEQGPALECYRDGVPVEVASVDRYAERWPRFAPAATAAGMDAVLALPMRLRGQVIGVLTLFGPAGVPPVHAEDRVIAQALADAATIAILQDREAQARELVAEQLEGALSSRIVIEQAKGKLSAMFEVGTDEAFELLRGYAREHRRKLSEVARQAIEGDGREFAPPGHQPTRQDQRGRR